MYGTYIKTLSRNEYTGETTFLFAPRQRVEGVKDGLITCTGVVIFADEDVPLYLDAVLQSDITYKVEKVRLPIPDKKEDLLKFLFPTMDSVKREKVAKALSDDILSFKEDAKIPLELTEQHFLLRKLEALKDWEELATYLLKEEIPLDKITTLVKRGMTIKKLLSNPYMDFLLSGIKCKFAERHLKIDPYDIKRLTGYAYETYLWRKNAGDSCVELKTFVRSMNARLSMSKYPKALVNLPIVLYLIDRMEKFLVLKKIDGKYYVYGVKEETYETDTLRNLNRLTSEQVTWEDEVNLSKIEQEVGLSLNEGQKAAVKGLLSGTGLKVLTGAPGTGKTTVMKAVTSGFRQKFPQKRIYLSATTGCASQVLKKSSGMDATTVHKMLEIKPYGTDDIHARSQTNPIPGDLIIVDEASMMGDELLSLLLNAVKSDTLLILVGDKEQLESVDYGSVLRELEKIKEVPFYYLTEVMRQQGTILHNARRIGAGQPKIHKDETFRCFDGKDEKQALEVILKEKTGKILTPTHKGLLGVDYLNKLLQKHRNNRKVILSYGQTDFREGDPVLFTETNYRNGYFNGESGTITLVNQELFVQLPDREIPLKKEDYCAITLAYAMTIHKSQGSEFEKGIILLPKDAEHMLTRRLLYTAVTRCKKEVVLIGTNETYLSAVNNTKERKRISVLAKRFEDVKN